MASAQPNDNPYPGLGRAGDGEENIWQPTFQHQTDSPMYVWDRYPAAGLQIQPCVESVEKFGSSNSLQLTARLSVLDKRHG